MKSKDENSILKFLQTHIDDERCYKPKDIFPNIEEDGSGLHTEEETSIVCRRLHAKNLIDMITTAANNEKGLKSCYRINQNGIDELNPNTREKNIYKLAVIGTISAIIAAIASVISIFF